MRTRTLEGRYGLWDELEHEWRESQTITTSCAFCDWTITAALRVTRAAARAHRRAVHPLVLERLPNPRARSITAAMREAA